MVNYDVMQHFKEVKLIVVGKSDADFFKPTTAFLGQKMQFRKIIFDFDVILTSPTPL